MFTRRRIPLILSFIVAAASFAGAQATQPAALAALDADVQRLFRHAQQRTVRVTVPIQLPWSRQLDPQLLQQFEAARARGEAVRIFIQRHPATTNSTQVGAEIPRVPLPTTTVANAEFIGLVLNKTGDVLVPLYIDRAYLKAPLHVTLDERRTTTASVVAADRQTSLSIVRLAEAAGEPAQFARAALPNGSVVLSLSPTRRAARLSVWSGGDENSVVVNLAGEFAAIVRNGHALYPSTFMPIVDQLLTGEPVHRARLGVAIRDVPPEDPQRGKLALLGARAAARVVDIEPESPAHRARVQPGDLIIGLGNDAIEDVVSFAAAIANRRGKTDLRIIRDGKEQTIAVDLQGN